MPAAVWSSLQFTTPNRRGPFGFNGIALLKPGVTLEQAARDLDDISVRIFPIWAAGFQDSGARLAPSRCATPSSAPPGARWASSPAPWHWCSCSPSPTSPPSCSSALHRASTSSPSVSHSAPNAIASRGSSSPSVSCSPCSPAPSASRSPPRHSASSVSSPRACPASSEIALDGRSFAFAAAVALLSGILVEPRTARHGVFSRRTPAATGLLSSPARGGASRRVGRRARAHSSSPSSPSRFRCCSAPACSPTASCGCSSVDAGFDPRRRRGARALASIGTLPERAPPRCRFWRQAEARALAVDGVTAAGFTSSLPPDNFGDVNNFDLIDRPVPAGTSQPEFAVAHRHQRVLCRDGRSPPRGASLHDGRLRQRRPPVLIVEPCLGGEILSRHQCRGTADAQRRLQ